MEEEKKLGEGKKKPRVISEKDVVKEAGVEEAVEQGEAEKTGEGEDKAGNAGNTLEQPVENTEIESVENKTLEGKGKKPRVKVIVEPVFGERGEKPTTLITGEKPRLARELEEQAARDVLPVQTPPGTPLEAEKPLTREEVVEKARRIWREKELEKKKGKFFAKLKRAIGLQ